MRFPSLTFVSFSLLLPSILALTITSPTADSTIDPTQPITITWTSTGSDPSSITLTLTNSSPGVLASDETLAVDIATSLGRFTVPADTVLNFGTGFVVNAVGSGGDVLASSAAFALGAGSNQVSTLSGGGETFISKTTEGVTSLASSVATVSGTTTTSTPARTSTSTSTRTDGVPSTTASEGGGATTASTAASTTASSSTSLGVALSSRTSSLETTTTPRHTSSPLTTETIFDSSPSSGSATAQATSTSSALAVQGVRVVAGGQVAMGAVGIFVGALGLFI